MQNRLADKIRGFGILASCLCLAGCSGTTGTPTAGPPSTSAYVWGSNIPTFDGGPPQTILKYSTVSPQVNSPVSTLTLPSSCNGGPITVDSNGQLYVACFSPSSSPQILVYPRNSAGAATPSRTIEMSKSSYEIATLTVDASGRLYVGSLLANTQVPAFLVTVYSTGANGTAAPLRTIQLPTDNGLTDVVVDSVGNIYVDGYPGHVNAGGPLSFVSVYSCYPYVAEPIRTINFRFFTYGVGVDATGDVFVSAGVGNGGNVTAVEEYAPDASGYASLVSTIELPQQPAGMEVGGGPVRFDRAGNMFTPVSFGNLSTPTTYILYSFAPDASDHAVPIVEIYPKDGYNTAFALN